jgi:hypothetical protein
MAITIAITIAVAIARLLVPQLRQDDAKDLRVNRLQASKRCLDPAQCDTFGFDNKNASLYPRIGGESMTI